MSLRIAIFQVDIKWKEINANLKTIGGYFKGVDPAVDLVVLPEMFLSGFSMDVNDIAMEMNSSYIEQLKQWASVYDLAIMGTLAIKENGKFYNRALFFHPDGKIEIYDKRHLFRMGKEDDYYNKGENRTIFKYRGFRIMPLICYDLRFPVWSRNRDEYDILVYMANWPKSRQKVWDILLKARAIENCCFVIGVNRIGKGGGIDYDGGSVMIDYKGNSLEFVRSDNSVKYCKIDMNSLQSFKEKFPVYLDADNFEIQ